MSVFSRKANPSKPPVNPKRIDFLGEQTGNIEDLLKTQFRNSLSVKPDVQRAYLARVSYDGSRNFSVALCLRAAGGVDGELQQQLGKVFTNIFRKDQFLDILFIHEAQENELRKVCRAFYQA